MEVTLRDGRKAKVDSSEEFREDYRRAQQLFPKFFVMVTFPDGDWTLCRLGDLDLS